MKPYTLRSSRGKWEQETEYEVKFGKRRWRYEMANEAAVVMGCLSFTYTFSPEDEYVYFAYCVPYSYSFMLNRVRQLQNDNPHFVHVDYSHSSAGGLTLPIISITNPSQAQKPHCLVIGRLHPGETQGSWTLDGFLRLLCSPKGYQLRQQLNFKIMPMVNADGVVLGNFRTGILGRDLNRVFDLPERYN